MAGAVARLLITRRLSSQHVCLSRPSMKMVPKYYSTQGPPSATGVGSAGIFQSSPSVPSFARCNPYTIFGKARFQFQIPLSVRIPANPVRFVMALGSLHLCNDDRQTVRLNDDRDLRKGQSVNGPVLGMNSLYHEQDSTLGVPGLDRS